MNVVVQIERMGAKGDGIAMRDGRALPVPYALPGETVTCDGDGRLADLVTAAPDRIAPFCAHYGICGGCKLQHWAAEPYAEWKRETVVQTLRHAGLDAEVAPLVAAHGRGRRRAIFHAKFVQGKAQLGFMAARTHDLIPIDTCPVLTPELAQAPAVAAAVIRPLAGLGKPLDVQITATDSGLDIDIRGAGKGFEPLRLKLTEIATGLDLARLSVHGEVIVERRAPTLTMGKALVTPPPGGFLQATAAGEEALSALVLAALGKPKRVADLFSGCGPFALRIAARCAVEAFDSDRPGIEALTRAARATPGLKPVKAEARDLFRRPLLPHELKSYDALVLDPPRAGAEAQVREIARARTPARIVYVSCDRESFARDAAILAAAGWRLETVTPVDQFAYTVHVELVGVFSL